MQMGVRYIGSKARLAQGILDVIAESGLTSGRFVDGFCGTGVVSLEAANRGYSVLANDALYSSALITESSLICQSEIDFSYFGSYENAVSTLNSLQGSEGYFWHTYSPSSFDRCGIERRYFTEDNAKKIDSIRKEISIWKSKGLIGCSEERLLLANLIVAANDVANTAGTYGCFLKKWTTHSFSDLKLSPTDLRIDRVDHEVITGDVFSLDTDPTDIVYLDPPYTKRQYASYYHIAETIAYNDEPHVDGVAGLRPWKHNASPFCYKSKALIALTDCISGLSAENVFLSYSSQGHVSLDDLISRLSSFGTVLVYELGEIGRYRPNKTASANGASVREFLIHIRKL